MLMRVVKYCRLVLVFAFGLSLLVQPAAFAEEPGGDEESNVEEITAEEAAALEPQPEDMQDPEEEDLAPAESDGCGDTLTADAEGFCAPYCKPETVYSTIARAERFWRFYGTSVKNSTGQTGRYTVRASTGGTLTFTVGGSVNAGIKASILAELKGEVHADITTSVTASIGDEWAVDVPPFSTRNADWGVIGYTATVRRDVTYSNCNRVRTTYKTEAPMRARWNVYAP